MEKLLIILIFTVIFCIMAASADILEKIIIKYIEEGKKKKIQQRKQNKRLFDYDREVK